jgi:hypothetical protein
MSVHLCSVFSVHLVNDVHLCSVFSVHLVNDSYKVPRHVCNVPPYQLS